MEIFCFRFAIPPTLLRIFLKDEMPTLNLSPPKGKRKKLGNIGIARYKVNNDRDLSFLRWISESIAQIIRLNFRTESPCVQTIQEIIDYVQYHWLLKGKKDESGNQLELRKRHRHRMPACLLLYSRRATEIRLPA